MKAYAEVDIVASEREVWTVLADVASWPTWNPAIRHAVRDEELEVGTRFRFSTEIGTLKCRVTEVDAPNLLSWKGRVLLLGERQTWRLEPRTDGTYEGGHIAGVRNLIESIQLHQPPRCGAQDGRAIVEMIAAVFESHRLGTEVGLPLTTRANPLSLMRENA